jgi:hypothetical protein
MSRQAWQMGRGRFPYFSMLWYNALEFIAARPELFLSVKDGGISQERVSLWLVL